MNATLTFSGTPDEIARVMEAVQKATAAMVVIPKSNEPTAIGEPVRFVSPELFERSLNRHKLTPLTQKLMRALYDANKDGGFVRRSKLLEELGFSSDEYAKLSGVLGKFGMRVKRTPGYVNGTSYFEYKRDDEDGEWCYRLPDHLRGVVREVLGDDVRRDEGTKSTENGSEAGDQS